VVAAAQRPARFADVWTPRVGHKCHRGLFGHWTPGCPLIKGTNDLHGPQDSVIRAGGMQRERPQPTWHELAKVTVPLPKEVDSRIGAGTNQPGGLRHGGA